MLVKNCSVCLFPQKTTKAYLSLKKKRKKKARNKIYYSQTLVLAHLSKVGDNFFFPLFMRL